jgi:molybdenum ABC transporter molybdate-binding protein
VIRLLALAALTVSSSGAVAAPVPPLTVYAAGSATGVLGAILDRYRAETGETVTLQTGPAGLMRERIEAGDKVDLFVSANTAHPETLHAAGKASATVVFASNRLCVSARHSVGLTRSNMLSRLLDPKVSIGTSTPKADPGGDYAQALFEKADSVKSGATAILKAKARQVVGGRIETGPAKPMTAAESLDAQGVDVSVGYCSSRKTTPDTSVDKVEVPPALAIRADYGMTIVTTSGDAQREAAAGRLALYLLSAPAQGMLSAYGFVPANGLDAAGDRRQ